MKALILLLAALALVGFLFHSCNVAIDADEARRNKEAQEWRAFTMQHHCEIARDGFWDAQATWQCDGGFEVKHR